MSLVPKKEAHSHRHNECVCGDISVPLCACLALEHLIEFF